MSSVLTLNGNAVVTSSGTVLLSNQSGSGGGSGGTSANIQTSKAYSVAAAGSATISPDTGYDAMQAVALTVPAGTATAASSISATGASISTSTNALTLSKTVSNTPQVTTAGYVAAGTAGNSSVSLTATATINPTLTASGATVTAPAGYYTTAATKSVTSGSATPAASISATGASVTTGTNTLTLSKSVSNTPQVSAGYVSSGTAGNSSISLTASVTTKGAATITPTTTNQTIASGTYLTGTQTIAGDTDLIAANIKKDVTIFNVTGNYEGSGGTVTLKPYAIRPDAELLQTYSDDFLVISGKGVTKPAYTTTSTTLITGGTALTPVLTLSNANYRYLIVMRYLTIPQYNITTTAVGRQEYTAMSAMYEIPAYAANVFSALVNTTKYASRNVAVLAVGNAYIREVYWSSATAIKLYTANSYGCAQTINTAPALSSGTAASPTLTFYTPNVVIRGSSTYLSSTYWSAITDIRCQYIYEVYRIPESTSSTYGIDGWGHYNNMLHNITCAQSSTHKLT